MSRDVQLSPTLLIGAANTMLGFARNREPDAELMLHEVGQPLGHVWDAAFVHHAGYWSHYAHDVGRSTWPLPATNDCNDWACFADAQGALSGGRPRAGDVFLLWSTKHKRFVHTGIVAAYRDDTGILPNGRAYTECDTIEGNIDPFGRWPRSGIHRHTRRLVAEKGDRIIRWTDLDRRHDVTMRATPAEICRALMLRPAQRTPVEQAA